MIRSALYPGDVMHHRFTPKEHRFNYTLTSWLVDIDQLEEMDQSLRWFGHNRRAPFSFHDSDYGFADGRPVREFIDQICADHQVSRPARVEFLCQVRCFGYVFNPLAIWFCYDESGSLSATLYEVRNTFGERHHYFVPISAPAKRYHHRSEKCFYVSPFMPMACRYDFHFRKPDEHLDFAIRQFHDDAPIFMASWKAERQTLSNRSLTKLLIRHPISTLKVIAAIHYEAFKLWRKGVSLVPRAPKSAPAVTKGQHVSRQG